MAIPTPTPSETLTNTTGPSTGWSPLTAQTCARMQAFTEFSSDTGGPVALQRSDQIDIAPAERRRVLEPAAVQIDQAGNDDADADAVAELRMAREHVFDASAELLDERPRLAAGRELAHGHERLPSRSVARRTSGWR